jgi:hypothetical protein
VLRLAANLSGDQPTGGRIARAPFSKAHAARIWLQQTLRFAATDLAAPPDAVSVGGFYVPIAAENILQKAAQ